MDVSVRALVKRFVRYTLGEYSPYVVYRSGAGASPGYAELAVRELDSSELEAIPEEWLRAQLWYAGFQSTCFGCFASGGLAGVCFYWYGERYASRGFWPLRDHEAKLVQILVAPEMRGRGIARTLIARSTEEMRQRGFRRMFARIWHSNDPSKHAFEAAGWERVAFVLEVQPPRLKSFRLKIPLPPKLSDQSRRGRATKAA